MSDIPPLRRPSDDIAELQRQLLRELAGIQREGDAWNEPTLFRAYLQHAQALAWQRVADGDLNGPRDILDHLLSAQPFADEHFPKIQGLAVQAALEIQQVLRSLYLADQVLEEARTRNRLADRDRSRTEREVLRILFENRGTYLRRGAVRARMDPEERPTPARVGQILVGLHEEGLVLRTHGRAQGSPSAAFYALSPFGLDICRDLWPEEKSVVDESRSGLVTEEAPSRLHESAQRVAIGTEGVSSLVVEHAVSLVADPGVPWEWRSILAGAIGNLHPTPALSAQLTRWIAHFPDDPGIATLIQVIHSNWKYRSVLMTIQGGPVGDFEVEEKINSTLSD